MVQSPQSHLNNQVNPSNHVTSNQSSVTDHNLLPPPKKKAKKKKRAKKKDEEPPKLDLASIMKISGIGDEDDMFDTDMMPEPEPQIQPLPPVLQHVEQPQITQMTVQHLDQLSPHNPPLTLQTPQHMVQPTQTINTNCPTPNPQDQVGNQMVAQIQMPVQNTISGHLRLAVGEDGRVILHHTPDPNQPEIDQATAQALIRSLTQGTGQNSQIISQLLGHAQNLSHQNVQQQQQTSNVNRGKGTLKQPPPNQVHSQMNSVIQGVHNPSVMNIQQQMQTQVCSKPTFTQQPQNHSSISVNVGGQRNIGQIGSIATSIPSGVVTSVNAGHATSKNLQTMQNTSGIQIAIGEQKPQLVKNEHPHKVGHSGQKSHGNTCKKAVGQVFMQNQQSNTVQRAGFTKAQSSNLKMQTGSLVNNRAVQHQIIKNPNVQTQHRNQHLEQHTNEQINQQNIHQISTQTVQSLNVQRCLDQNVHKITVSGLQQNSLNILGGNTLPDSMAQNLEQNIIHGFVEGPSNSGNCPQQEEHHQSSNPNLNLHQPKLNVHNLQNKQHNVIFSSDYPTSCNNTIINTSAGQTTKQVQNSDMLNSAATNILNNAPKITPEILNALSNLNPNDQLLIANANGQMQVISQQLLQQFLTGQINAQRPTVNQNQTQKIVIGEADASNTQNLPGVQINTPTSQIIVNSSGGAPTIQNNIQNIVVQAAPNQMPHQIQIQNQAFPSQFIDNLNQQQIRNLSSTNKTTVTNSAPVTQMSNQGNQSNQSNFTMNTAPAPAPPPTKKKVVKRTKVTVSVNQTGYTQGIKTARTSIATSKQTVSKDSQINSCTNPKTEPGQIGQLGVTGRIVTSNIQTVGIQTQPNQTSVPQVSVPSNGQMVQRTPRYIQLPVQKQQMLKSIQIQIQSISSRKTQTPAEQALLNKLYTEHMKIVESGKIVSAPSLTIPTASETNTNASIASPTVFTVSHPLTPSVQCKNQQTSTAQTQTILQFPRQYQLR